jgi:ATP-dependent exoDNAse (exonuclease V) beta subunit
MGESVRDGTARAEAILATTFTRQAAAELFNRARTGLLRNGRGQEAQALLSARIGTVNAVCGSLVTDFSFELGLSPELRILDETGADLALKRALASVVTDETSEKLQGFRYRFDASFDWHYEIQRLIEAARANGLNADQLMESSRRSVASLDACLGVTEETTASLDAGLRSAIESAVKAIDAGADATVGTQKYRDLLVNCGRDLDNGCLRWGDWARLTKEVPTKKSLAHAAAVQTAAARHIAHPRLREEMHDLIRLMFDVAVRGLSAYERLKHDQGLLDFIDQEVQALRLLASPATSEVLKDELDLVLVDEFQDTSPLQLTIFLKLAELAKESVWVGDPKQAIYGFRGTDPALMDAAIESLASPSRDPDLVAAAVDVVTRRAPIETLSNSYRSRPALVEITNAIFARAFSRQQGMPEERVKIAPTRTDAAELGPAVGHWPLSGEGRMTKQMLAHAVAAGVRDLIGKQPVVWDKDTASNRSARASDLAILCRTNDQCLHVSEALGQLGIASVVARVGLLRSAEAQTVMAGIRLWVDPKDTLAAATLVRIVEHPDDAVAFFEKAMDPDGAEKLARNPTVASVLAARDRARDLDVRDVVDAIIDAADLRLLCAAWGDSIQRTANLDALRAASTRYIDERRAGRDAPSLVGFLAYLEELGEEGMWGEPRTDATARVGSDDAVTVSTWHAAKGLEWPIVILFGLESVREAAAYGVHVLSDRTTVDLSDPLGGRWIHFWPNPYSSANQGGPVKAAYAQSDAHKHVSGQAAREALRVLYVGWTRARDRLILAVQQGKFLNGLLRTLTDIEPDLIYVPDFPSDGVSDVTWASHDLQVEVTPARPSASSVPPPRPGTVRVGRALAQHVRASIAPSSASPRPAWVGEPVRLGRSIGIRDAVDVNALGSAMHDFFAADERQRPLEDRKEMAVGLLGRYRVASALQARDLVECGDRLWRWVHERFGGEAVVRTEWPVGLKVGAGTRILGTSDLIVESDDAIAVIDHKSFGLKTALSKADLLAGQLGCYADVVVRAHPTKTVSTWVHLPLEGVVLEIGGGPVAMSDPGT